MGAELKTDPAPAGLSQCSQAIQLVLEICRPWYLYPAEGCHHSWCPVTMTRALLAPLCLLAAAPQLPGWVFDVGEPLVALLKPPPDTGGCTEAPVKEGQD